MIKKAIPVALLGLGVLSMTGCGADDNISNSISNLRENVDDMMIDDDELFYEDGNYGTGNYGAGNYETGFDTLGYYGTDNQNGMDYGNNDNLIFDENFDITEDAMDGENDDVFNLDENTMDLDVRTSDGYTNMTNEPTTEKYTIDAGIDNPKEVTVTPNNMKY